MKHFKKYLRKYWKGILVSNILLAFIKFAELATPQILGESINRVQEIAKGAAAAGQLVTLIAAFLLLAALNSIMSRWKGIQNSKLSSSLMKDIRDTIFNKLQALSFKYYGKTSSGQIISRVTHDVNILRDYYDTIMFLIPDIFSFLTGAFVLMLLMHLKLTLVALSTMPLTVYLMIRARRDLRKKWRECDDRYGDVTTVLQENISGIRVVKSFARESSEISKFDSKVKTYVDSWLDAFGYWVKRIPLTEFIFGITAPLTLVYGGYLIIGGQLTIGDLTKFFFYLMGFNMRIMRIGRIVNSIENSNAAAERLGEILDAESEEKDTENVKRLPLKGNIAFRGVSFGYDGKTRVLENIDIEIRAGEVFGIAGPTGSGKSTLLNLIPRFYYPSGGSIIIDGKDINGYRLCDYRKAIGIVFQDSFLFSATLRENIAYGNAGADSGDIEKYARACGVTEFSDKLPDKYETVIGERGVTLSGGQKQRIAIARALCIKPSILLLDNPTSNLDSETERHVIEDILNLGITTIIISQKINLLKHTDRIAVIEGGRITGIGTHDELIGRPGFYRQVYSEQFGLLKDNK